MLIFHTGGRVQCRLEDILIFTSGLDKLPHWGFGDDPILSMIFGDENLPTAATCEMCLYLPCKHTTYEEFKESMVLGIKGNDGFGTL